LFSTGYIRGAGTRRRVWLLGHDGRVICEDRVSVTWLSLRMEENLGSSLLQNFNKCVVLTSGLFEVW
jgi:hypothetical protein